jgi:ADP-heptose:LPS heptosyltransferase
MFGFNFDEIAHQSDLKILLCNVAYVGDLILSSSVLPVLKKAFPQSKIGFLIGTWAKDILDNHVLVDWVHFHDSLVFNRKPIPKRLKKMQDFKTKKIALREIKKIHYDLALDLHSYYYENSAQFLWESEIPLRVGYWCSPQSFFYNRQLFWNCMDFHMLENHQMLLREIGIDEEYMNPFLPCLNYHQEVKKPILPKDYLVLHVGTGEATREWELTEWKKLAEQLDKLHFPILFLGKGPKEKKSIEFVSSRLKNSLNLCDKLSIKECSEVIKNARFLIGLESMAGHLAAYHGTPALLIYMGNNAINWRPYHPFCHIIKPSHHDFLLCKENKVKNPLSLITFEKVYDKVEALLSAHELI